MMIKFVGWGFLGFVSLTVIGCGKGMDSIYSSSSNLSGGDSSASQSSGSAGSQATTPPNNTSTTDSSSSNLSGGDSSTSQSSGSAGSQPTTPPNNTSTTSGSITIDTCNSRGHRDRREDFDKDDKNRKYGIEDHEKESERDNDES
jgi:hypothetical protein